MMPVSVYESYTRVCLFNLLRLNTPRGLEMEIVLSRTDNPALQLEKNVPLSQGHCLYLGKINSEANLSLYSVAAAAAAAATKSLQSCPTLCDPIDGSPPGSPVPGILQTRILELVSISFSNAWKWKVKMKLLSRIRLLSISWTTDYQAPPSMGFSRQEY